MYIQHPHDPGRATQLTDWLEDVAILVVLFSAASVLAAIVVLLIIL